MTASGFFFMIKSCLHCSNQFETTREVAKFCGLKCSSNHSLASRNEKIKAKQREKPPHPKHDEIIRLWNEGKTTGEIGSLLNIGRVLVRYYLKRAGLFTPRMPQKQKGWGLGEKRKPEPEFYKSQFDCPATLAHYDDNKHWIRHPVVHSWRIAKRDKRNNLNPSHRIKNSIRTRIWKMLRRQYVYKTNHTVEYLGCTIEQLKAHLSSLFKPDMTWQNYGELWEIDHIRPCASFDLTQQRNQYECFHYSNTKPSYITENRSKSSHWNGQHHKHKKIEYSIANTA